MPPLNPPPPPPQAPPSQAQAQAQGNTPSLPGSLSHYCSLSTFNPGRFLSISPTGSLTLKCLLKSIATPDISKTLQTLKLRTFANSQFSNLKHINALLLSGNRISNVDGIVNSGGCLDFCHSISLADNLITDVEEIFKLSAIRSLRSLVVAGNPCNASGGELNRSRIVKAFEGRLRNLDGVDCSSLTSIDQAVKECMFQDVKGGQRLINLSFYLFELDRAVCALRIKSEINNMYGEESSFNSSIESLSLAEADKELPPFQKLIKVWKNKNTKGLDRATVVKNLQRRLNLIIRKTRKNRHAIEEGFLPRLEANPSQYFGDVEEDWAAAFKGVMMPIEREVERLELECRTLTGELDTFSVNSDDMADIEKSAIMFGNGSDLEEGEEGQTEEATPSKANYFQELTFDEIASLPSTPPGSVKSNMPLPAFDDEEHYKRERTKETYNQLLQKMERGKLHDKDYKPRKGLEEAGEWVHPPTLSSPPRKLKAAEKREKVRSPEPLREVLEDINMSRTIQKMSQVHKMEDANHHESVAWDVLRPEDVDAVIQATPDVEWKLPPPPTLNPPPRVPLPPTPIPPPLPPNADNMKKLQSQSEHLFDAMCDNHEVHLSLFQINSALRKCADSFSNARNRYLMSIQAKMMYLESMMIKWKKEDPKLKKAVEDAADYISKINKIDEAKEKAVYDLQALKRHTAHLHKTIDAERDDHERLVEVRNSVSAQIEEVNQKLGVDEREQILKDRELEKRGKQFVARFSLRMCFKIFRARVGRQKDIKMFAAKCRISFDLRVKFCRFLRWRNFLRELRSERLKVKTVRTLRQRKIWRSIRAVYKIHAISTRHARLKLLRAARRSISHWHNLSRARKNVKKVMDHMSAKALLKNTLLRWRRFLRLSNLSPGELREASDKADKKYKQILIRRWRRHVDQLHVAVAEKTKAVRNVIKKRVCQGVMDRWYFKFSIESLGKRALIRRMYTHWKATWTVRVSALAFWNAATHHDDLKLKRKVFMPWMRHALNQAKLMKSRKALRIMLKCSSAASVSHAFSVWQRIYHDYKKNRKNTKKAVLHYFSRLYAVYFAEWADFVQRAKTMSRILPLFANVSQRGKFMFAWRKWRTWTLESQRESNVAKGVEKTAIAFLKRMLGAQTGVCFGAWRGFAEKRRRCRLNAKIIQQRTFKVRRLRYFRTWLNGFVMSRMETWRSQEHSYVGDDMDLGIKAKLATLTTYLKETQEVLDEDSGALYGLEAELSRAQGELMERQMKLDSKLHKLKVVEGKLKKADEKWKTLEAERLKVEEKLTVTKMYFEEFKKRPKEEKWSLGSSSSASARTNASSASGASGASTKSAGLSVDIEAVTEEKLSAASRKKELSRRVRGLKQRLQAVVTEKKSKLDLHMKVKVDADKKRDDVVAKISLLKEETEKLRLLKEKHEQDVSRFGLVNSTMATSYTNDLVRLETEEKELASRLAAARKRQQEVDSVLWRKNAEIRGLTEEAKLRKGRGKDPGKYVFKTDAEILATVAEARGGRRVEETRAMAESARKSSSAQVKQVIEIYDEGVFDEQEEEIEKASYASASTKSKSTSQGKSGGVPSRLLQKIGLQKKRTIRDATNSQSLASGKLASAKAEAKHVRTQVAIKSLSENLFDESALLQNSESAALKRDIESLESRIMKRL